MKSSPLPLLFFAAREKNRFSWPNRCPPPPVHSFIADRRRYRSYNSSPPLSFSFLFSYFYKIPPKRVNDACSMHSRYIDFRSSIIIVKQRCEQIRLASSLSLSLCITIIRFPANFQFWFYFFSFSPDVPCFFGTEGEELYPCICPRDIGSERIRGRRRIPSKGSERGCYY